MNVYIKAMKMYKFAFGLILTHSYLLDCIHAYKKGTPMSQQFTIYDRAFTNYHMESKRKIFSPGLCEGEHQGQTQIYCVQQEHHHPTCIIQSSNGLTRLSHCNITSKNTSTEATKNTIMESWQPIRRNRNFERQQDL